MRESSEQSRRKASSPDRRRSDENNDEKLTCLYIGNIDKKIDSEQLNALFRKYGQLQYCYLVYEPTSSDRSSKQVKISRGYGFAKYVKFDDLIKAKEQLDGFEVNGRKIKVQISKRNKPRQSTPGRYLGKKKVSSPHHHGQRNRGRSYSRSSSDSYYERRRRHQRKQKHRKRYDRSDRLERSRSKDRSEHRGRRSISEQRERRRARQ